MTSIMPSETENITVSPYDGLEFAAVKQQVAGYTAFKLGRQNILQAAPVFSRLEANRQLQRLSQTLALTEAFGPMPFGGIFDVGAAIDNALRDVTLTPEELTQIAQQSYGIAQIKNYMQQGQTDYDQIADLIAALDDNMATANAINRCIDSSGQILDNASPKLASIRRQIKMLTDSITAKIRHYMAVNSAYLQDDIIAQRNGRAVVLVKNTYKNTAGGLQYGTSLSGQATYVEPAELVSANNELSAAEDQQRQEIARILFALSQMVKQHAAGYRANLQTLGLLDSLSAKAQWAHSNDAVVGAISENYDLSIEYGRHPLIERSRVVANSYHLKAPVRTVLITGPNTGGKTVSLKLIGLFVVMHLAGFALPCRQASIPVYDQLFYDIGDQQSIQQDLSTFSAHISKLAHIIRLATSHSLVLLDELGSGTDPAEGQALASAVLAYFREKQVYLVATTHYAKLKSYAHQFDDVLLASVEFDTAALKPTYRYIEGLVGQSNAFDIAARCGVDRQVIDQARRFKKEQQTDSDELAEKLQSQLAVNRQLQEKLVSQNNDLELAKAHLEKVISDQQARQDEIISQANQQAADIVEKTQDEADQIISQLKQQERYRQQDVAVIQHKIAVMDTQPETAGRTASEDIKVGDWVKVVLSNQVGLVKELDKKTAIIECGGTRVRTKAAGLVKTAAPVEIKSAAPVYRRAAVSFSTEINLVGQHVDDGLALLDKYLDDAIVARAPFVRVIHGIGSGVLRQAVWEKLKTYQFIDHFEMAPSAQGGAGATLVYFKGHQS